MRHFVLQYRAALGGGDAALRATVDARGVRTVDEYALRPSTAAARISFSGLRCRPLVGGSPTLPGMLRAICVVLVALVDINVGGHSGVDEVDAAGCAGVGVFSAIPGVAIGGAGTAA